MSKKPETTNAFKIVGNEIATNFKTKSAGFYVAVAGVALTLVQLIIYAASIPEELFNVKVVFLGSISIGIFVALTIFKETSSIAPIPLMVCSLLGLAVFVNTEGLIDYVSTEFFDGVTLAKIFNLNLAVWFSVLSFVLIFVLASVAMYLRQNKKDKERDSEKMNAKEVQDEKA